METKPTTKTKNELPFSNILAVNLDDLYYRVFTLKKASLIIIDGGLGEGKTTLGVHIADYINSLHKIPLIEIDGPQLGLGGEQFMEKIEICSEQKLPIIIYDEAGDFNKRGALTRFNAMLNRMFEMFRAYKVIVILCLPSFNVLDGTIMDNKVPRLLLNLYDRTINQGNFKGFGYDRMSWVKFKMKNLPVKSYAYNYVEPNFFGHFKDLDPERSRQLDALSTANKKASNVKGRIKYEGLISRKDVASALSRSPGAIKKMMLKLKIEPFRKIGRDCYYKEDVIEQLNDYYDGVSL